MLSLYVCNAIEKKCIMIIMRLSRINVTKMGEIMKLLDPVSFRKFVTWDNVKWKIYTSKLKKLIMCFYLYSDSVCEPYSREACGAQFASLYALCWYPHENTCVMVLLRNQCNSICLKFMTPWEQFITENNVFHKQVSKLRYADLAYITIISSDSSCSVVVCCWLILPTSSMIS